MRKNVAGQKVGAQMVSATDGSAFTGSVTVAVTLDAGTQATGSVGSGACTHEGNGYHTYAPAQAETNGDLAAFTFTGTGAVPVTVQIFTSFPQTGDSYAVVNSGTFGNSALKTLIDTIDDFVDTEVAAILAAVDTEVAAIKAKTDNLPANTATEFTNLNTKVDTIDDFLDTEIAAILAAVDTEIADIRNRLPAGLTANGNLKVSVLEFLTTALTEASAGQVTGGVKKFFDVASPVGTVNSIPNATAGASGGIAIVGSAMTLGVDAVDAAALKTDAVTEIVTGVFARAMAAAFSSLTFDQVLRVLLASAAGKSSGLDTGTIKYRNLADSGDVIAATGDADGNRTAVTITP